MHQPPATLIDAYVEATKESTNLRQHIAGTLPSLGPTTHLGKVQGLNQDLAN